MPAMLIKGLTKEEFGLKCIELADDINPDWREEVFNVTKFEPDWIWKSPASRNHGFALTNAGAKLLEECLNVTPYVIVSSERASGELLVRLDKCMPWPYVIYPYIGETQVLLYSTEMAVWAALQDNDLMKLIEMFER